MAQATHESARVLLAVAGGLALAIGLVHSWLGERLIFRRLRERGIVPRLPAPPLQARNVFILWATWHIATVLGACLGIVLLALAAGVEDLRRLLVWVTAGGYVVGAALVLTATRGRHPGWIGMLAVGLLALAAIRIG